jgi:hypothetical protein
VTTPQLVPSPGAVLDRLWSRLPEHYRLADAEQGSAATLTNHPMYRWLAGVCAQLGQVEALINRFDSDQGDGRSDLTDPAGADVAWLPWLAQFVGVQLAPGLSEMEKRDAVRYASAGWRAGTKSAIADAAKTELTGTRFARVYDHTVNQPGDGGVWDVLIVTRTTETPDVPAVLAAVLRRGAKPAGVVLRHRAYEASWDTVTATYPTWTALQAAGSWDRIQEAGL